MRTSAALGLLLLLPVASCNGTSTSTVSAGGMASSSVSASPVPPSVTDLDSFTQALETAGFTVRVGEQQNESLFTVAAQPVSIDGVRVTAFEYPSEDALDDVRALIGGDGYSVPMRDGGIAHVDWVAAPHLFNAGRVMVLYVGDEEGTLEALKLVLGKQFAGA